MITNNHFLLLVDFIYPDLCFAALFSGESFSEKKPTAAEHLKKSPVFSNSPALSPALRLSSKLLHHSNSTGRSQILILGSSS